MTLAAALPAQEPAFDITEALAHAVDLPTAKERAAEALRLAKQEGVTLEDWVFACKNFGLFEPEDSGLDLVTKELAVGQELQRTELFVYTPEAYSADNPMPLLLALHGTGGSGEQMQASWRAVADAAGCIVLAPTTPGQNMGYTFSEDERANTMAALRWARRNYNVDENKIFCTGVSRGGHLTWDLALRNPGIFAAIAPCVGGPRLTLQRGQNNLRYAPNVVDVPIRDLQGAKDDPLMIFNLHVLFERLQELGAKDAQYIEFPERGHSFDPSAVDWVQLFGDSERAPWPERVSLASADKEDAGSAYVRIEKHGRSIVRDFDLEVSNKWKRMNDTERRLFIQKETDKRTATLIVTYKGKGEFLATGRDVSAFRILVDKDHVDPKGRVWIRFGKRKYKKTPRHSASVLLSEFVESFDRGFLPTAAVTIP